MTRFRASRYGHVQMPIHTAARSARLRPTKMRDPHITDHICSSPVPRSRCFPQLAGPWAGVRVYMRGTRVRVCVCMSLGCPGCRSNVFTFTDAARPSTCALTGEKGDPRLSHLIVGSSGCRSASIPRTARGFGLETALTQVAAKAFYLFTGSIKLLSTPVLSGNLQHHQKQSMFDAQFTHARNSLRNKVAG
jgi:hypothetical protein